jgi:ABC-type enterochelin transport system permease subunit
MSSTTTFSWQQKWTAITPKPFALISILSSSYIIHHVLKSTKRRSQIFHRLLLGLSICDVFASISFFMGTWPIPRGTPGVYLASGTKATCDAQVREKKYEK